MTPTMRERLKKNDTALTLARRRAKHFNNDGESDKFSWMVMLRIADLNLTKASFADKTEAVTVASSIAKKQPSEKTSRSLVTRVLLGQRALPIGRAISWARALNLTDPQRRQEFLVIAIIAGGLRDVRRNLSTKNRSRSLLIKHLSAALDAHVAAFSWGTEG